MKKIECLVLRPKAEAFGLPYCGFVAEPHERITFIKHLRAAHGLTYKAALATYEHRVARAR